ncbi:hypothetical protein N7462_007517 [Penicillium macrosclerotiorum]|uniref:uncharacterized protein n=1 Tax=Penicillium macrosclerotiorum TaxID=303699 RepID=UPI002548A92E|nr:uncharacterized protein N7462_007517 [Penicillium macrosclerotiorum]KAJ5679273.1 hypothetical protein N7462_007517 [Penicillium macrosclerotiorum]
MPKKQKRSFVYKPSSSSHPSLNCTPRDNGQLRRPTGSTLSDAPSVNDLIGHLRRTQVPALSDSGPESPSRAFASHRSVHPSLHSFASASPSNSPYRDRGRPLRLAPGPLPPQSWLTDGGSDPYQSSENPERAASELERVHIFRIDRLPGAVFPAETSLLHGLLKTMALNWAWHLDYDGIFVAQLPTHLKELLLSYVALYAVGERNQPLKGRMKGLKPLFLTASDHEEATQDEIEADKKADAAIFRLDLSYALGYWMTFKQLSKELFLSPRPVTRTLSGEFDECIPTSWDDVQDDEHMGAKMNEGKDSSMAISAATNVIPKSLSQGLRFSNLRYLSLGHPVPAAASWNSLLHLLSRLSIITHLSLAHWPAPTRTPNNPKLRIRPPGHRGPALVHGGTDMYSGIENNWAEAAGILRQLSRYTYCLKWLDFEGCTEWLPALVWTGTDPDGRPSRPGSSGPEWNGSWRDVEWIGMGPGFELPPEIDSIDVSANIPDSSLAASIHAPVGAFESLNLHRDIPAHDDLPWDVEQERFLKRRGKERAAWKEACGKAYDVQNQIQIIRRLEKGKWLFASVAGDLHDNSPRKNL